MNRVSFIKICIKKSSILLRVDHLGPGWVNQILFFMLAAGCWLGNSCLLSDLIPRMGAVRDNVVLFVFNTTTANDKCIVLFCSSEPRTRGLAWPGVSPVQRQSSSVSWLSVMAETGGSRSVTQSLWSIMSFLLKDASLSNYH